MHEKPLALRYKLPYRQGYVNIHSGTRSEFYIRFRILCLVSFVQLFPDICWVPTQIPA